jgi:GT2 family glycosyltransferase
MGCDKTKVFNNASSRRISVILITMNRSEILKNCLESIRFQNFVDYEIIVVDNASSDGTADMIQSLFPDVRYFYLGANLGVAGGRNYGLRMASGEICVFIDDDACFADINALENIEAYFNADKQLGCLAFRIVQPKDGVEIYNSIPRADKERIDTDYECSYFCGAGFACRRDLFMKVGMFWDALFFIGEELDFSYRLIDRGYKIVRSSSISVIHYETPQARVSGKWIYYGVKSRCWVAIRNLPWINVFSYTLLWWIYYFFFSVRYGHPVFFWIGIKDALTGLPQVLKSRYCISRETIKKLKILLGRVYY